MYDIVALHVHVVNDSSDPSVLYNIMHVSITPQTVWVQDPPDGLPAAAAGSRQEPLQHLQTTITETDLQIEQHTTLPL